MTRRKSAIKDPDALKKAVARIKGAKYLGVQKGRGGGMHSQQGHQVQLPGWHYPVTINTKTGECTFDNYSGRWGEEKHLDSLKQGYAVEAAKAKAEEDGHAFEEYTLADGSIRCVVNLGGGTGYETGAGGDGSGWDVGGGDAG
jgi:hypothetical protein